MTLPYLFRLVCLSLAAFFLIHLALGLAISVTAPTAIRMAERLTPSWAARFLLALRLFPSGFAAFVVAGLCVPSYLRLEPEANAEYVGLACLAAALLGMATWALSISRGVRAVMRSRRYIRHFQRAGRKQCVAGERSPVWVVEGSGHCLALAGVIRPRLVISRSVIGALSPEQLRAALRHEGAHRVSRDNFKRLLVLLTPAVFSLPLERAWAKFTEWAADDRAVAGDSSRSLSLASALVQVARLGVTAQPSPLATSLLANGQDLSARIDRLLRAVPREPPQRAMPTLITGATLVLAGSMAAVMAQPSTLSAVHRLLEHLVR